MEGKSIILSCQFLKHHLDRAQEKMGTDIPVIELDTTLHREPEKMRERILEEISRIPPEYDTILVSMGFCGGSWKNVVTDRRVVIPRLDDCITLLLTTDDTWQPNLKEKGCMYMTDNKNKDMTIPSMLESAIQEYGEKKGRLYFDVMFQAYSRVAVIDTGAFDSYDPEYLAYAQEAADLINGSLEHVPGSNMILEKLVSGNWDQQFLVLSPGEIMEEADLFKFK